MYTSEVAQLRRRIELECKAVQQAMTGLTVGMSFHQFIYMRMQRIGDYQKCLADCIGKDEANHIVGELYCKAMEGEEHTLNGEVTSS